MRNAPDQPLRLLRTLIPKRYQPWLRGIHRGLAALGMQLEEPFRTAFPYTQVHPNRLRALAQHARTVCGTGVAGDVVECGVLDGGAAAIMAAFTRECRKRIHLFDAWEGLPQRSTEDGPLADPWVGDVVGSPRRVLRIMRLLAIDEDRLVFHKGWFRDTFPVADISAIALMHIDCDFYEPTRAALARWAPLVAPGGIVQFDDYEDFVGCRRAVDEFLAEHSAIRLERLGAPGTAYFIRFPGPR